MKKLFTCLSYLLPWATLVCVAQSQAATYYISDCTGPSAHGSCVAGSNSNNGTSMATPWKDNASNFLRSAIMAAQPGDQFLFAKGMSMANLTIWPMRVDACVNTNACVLNPVIFDSYTPPWGGTARPILAKSDDGDGVFAFSESGGNNTPDGGYIVRNLEFRGTGTGTVSAYGIVVANSAHDITIDNIVTDGFNIGVNVWAGTVNGTNPVIGKPWNISLTNSTIKNAKQIGTLWGGSDSRICGNTFDNNGAGGNDRDHNAYLGGYQSGRMLFCKNTFLNNTITGGVSVSVNLVTHGSWDELDIVENFFYQAPGTTNGASWAIAVDGGYDLGPVETPAENFTRVRIARNTIVNPGGIGIGCHACISPVIENNKIVVETDGARTPIRAIAVPDRVNSGDGPDTGATIRNNGIWIQTPMADDVGIEFGEGQTPGTNLNVVGNLISFGNNSAAYRCFDFLSGTTAANFADFSRNLCYRPGVNSRFSAGYATQAAGEAVGLNLSGITADPLFLAPPASSNGWSMALQSGSPARNIVGATGFARLDAKRCVRVNPDAGPEEYFASACTPVPAQAWVRRKN